MNGDGIVMRFQLFDYSIKRNSFEKEMHNRFAFVFRLLRNNKIISNPMDCLISKMGLICFRYDPFSFKKNIEREKSVQL